MAKKRTRSRRRYVSQRMRANYPNKGYNRRPRSRSGRSRSYNTRPKTIRIELIQTVASAPPLPLGQKIAAPPKRSRF